MNDNKNNDERSKEIFSVWENTSKNGKKYFRGKLKDGTEIIGFANDNKKNEREPDIRFYKKDEVPERTSEQKSRKTDEVPF
jgi:hypothetical protein